MIQLKVYPTADKIKEDSIFLDLYDTQPIKLTISIEDIITADATSAFSRTFKVPATRHNALFFQNAFDVNGVTYDITKKKPAEVLVDGAEFRQGHIRLQKIYVNGDQDKIDYELLFLGETRDFSSTIADKPLCQLIMPDLTAIQGDVFERTDLEASWQAFPEGSLLSSGLADGNLLFPLIDFGNTYDDDGNPIESVITVNDSSGSNTFTKNNHPLAINRMKPMIRAKRIWDQIFEDADYTYDSAFLDSDRFHQMYVSAFGNSESVGIDLEQSNDTQFTTQENTVQPLTGFMEINDVVYSPSTAFNQGNTSYVIAETNGPNAYFVMAGNLSGAAQVEQSDYGYVDIFWRTELINTTTNTVLAFGNNVKGGGTSAWTWDSRNGAAGVVSAGDVLKIQTDINQADYDTCTSAYWECTSAPGAYLVAQDLDCEYKQIDFVKDILTMFRLVMQPDTNRPKHFIIEPWQDFIGSGDLYDWSNKLVKDKDFVIEPLFDSQSQTIEFSFVEDEDYINSFHFDNYKHVYGWLQFNSGNELLKGNRDVQTTEIAPTPINQINHGGTNSNHAHPEWVIPNIYKTNTEGAGSTLVVQNDPIKPKTRFLFYNGLKDINQQASGNNKQWYLGTGNAAGKQIQWPLVTPYENWPITENSLNLNWYNDIKYYNIPGFNPTYNGDGQTLFTEYWSRYIESIYNKYSRKITAYFVLDNTDLQNLTFDDVVSVNGIYYRPQLISNAEVGNKTQVKVELITLLDYQSVFRDELITGLSLLGVAPTVANGSGSIDITTNGTPTFSILLNTGQTSSYTDTPGLAPYNFIMDNVAPGTYDLELTDSLQRTINGPVTVPPFANTPAPTSWIIRNAQDNFSQLATYNNAFSPGDVVDLVGQPGACWTILSSSTNPPNVTIAGLCQPASGQLYDARDCDTFAGYLLEKDGTNFQVGDVINYEKNSTPGQIRCATIVSNTSSGTPTATLYSQNTYQCGDLVHCFIEQ